MPPGSPLPSSWDLLLSNSPLFLSPENETSLSLLGLPSFLPFQQNSWKGPMEFQPPSFLQLSWVVCDRSGPPSHPQPRLRSQCLAHPAQVMTSPPWAPSPASSGPSLTFGPLSTPNSTPHGISATLHLGAHPCAKDPQIDTFTLAQPAVPLPCPCMSPAGSSLHGTGPGGTSGGSHHSPQQRLPPQLIQAPGNLSGYSPFPSPANPTGSVSNTRGPDRPSCHLLLGCQAAS